MPSNNVPRPTRRAILRAGSAAAASVGLAGCLVVAEPYTEESERTFDPGEANELIARTDSGDLTLTGGDVDAVTGTVRKESRSGEDALDEVTVVGTVEDDTLVVEPRWDTDSLNVTVSVDLTVPTDLAVVEASSSNGDVTADGVTGDGSYVTTNGDVDVTDVDGFVSIESTNGDLRASGVSGLDGARTTNGDVSVGVLALRDDVSCRSNNGDVTAAVPEDLGARVELRTSNGDAEVSGVSMTVDFSGERRIEGTVSAGDNDGESDGDGASDGVTDGASDDESDGASDADPENTLELRSTNGDVTILGL